MEVIQGPNWGCSAKGEKRERNTIQTAEMKGKVKKFQNNLI
jgi:hypothetical protein